MADMAINAGRAFVAAEWPKTLLKSEAAMVRSELRNSSRETPANYPLLVSRTELYAETGTVTHVGNISEKVENSDTPHGRW